jgi:hypothetical protein
MVHSRCRTCAAKSLRCNIAALQLLRCNIAALQHRCAATSLRCNIAALQHRCAAAMVVSKYVSSNVSPAQRAGTTRALRTPPPARTSPSESTTPGAARRRPSRHPSRRAILRGAQTRSLRNWIAGGFDCHRWASGQVNH